MKKAFVSIVVFGLVTIFFTACKEQSKNEQIISVDIHETDQTENYVETTLEIETTYDSEVILNYDSGYPGGVLDEANSYCEVDESINGTEEEKKDEMSVGTSEQMKNDVTESDTKIDEVDEPIQDDIDEGDLLELPEISSGGVL